MVPTMLGFFGSGLESVEGAGAAVGFGAEVVGFDVVAFVVGDGFAVEDGAEVVGFDVVGFAVVDGAEVVGFDVVGFAVVDGAEVGVVGCGCGSGVGVIVSDTSGNEADLPGFTVTFDSPLE